MLHEDWSVHAQPQASLSTAKALLGTGCCLSFYHAIGLQGPIAIKKVVHMYSCWHLVSTGK